MEAEKKATQSGIRRCGGLLGKAFEGHKEQLVERYNALDSLIHWVTNFKTTSWDNPWST